MSELAYAQQQPSTIDELAFLVAAAEKNNTAVVAGSPGRVPKSANVNALMYVDMSAFTKVLEYSVPDQVIHVETGIKLGDLRELLAANNQWWPVYLPDEWTLLDAINRGDAGSVEHKFQSVRDVVLGCTVVTGHASGIINCGGRVVKNVTGYDMTKLFVGSYGSLGIVVSAFLRLYAKPQVSQSMQWEYRNCGDAIDLCHELIDSGLPLYAVSVEAAGREGGWTVHVQAAGVQAVVDEVVAAASAIKTKAKKPKILRGDKDASLWKSMTKRFYSDRGDGGEPCQQVLAPMTRFAAGLGEELMGAAAAVEFRPFVGRCVLRGIDFDTAGKIASKFAAPASPIVVAGEDDQYNWCVKRAPEQDADGVRAELQRRVKMQFDPSRILNPFVSL